jgi:hypothetical protein
MILVILMLNLLDEQVFQEEKDRILKKYDCKNLDDVLEKIRMNSNNHKTSP